MMHSNLWQKTVRALTAGAVTLAFAPAASASEPAPSDASILGAKTVSVSPVLATGLSREAAWDAVGQTLAVAHEGRKASGFRSRDAITLDADTGFGFAGSSATSDIFVLHYAMLLGSLATNMDDPAAMASTVETLEEGRQHLASLTPAALGAIDQLLASAKGGQLSGAAMARVMGEAERGIATGDARAHGYLAAGTWLGLGVVVASAGAGDATFIGMAEPLAVMLDEDAYFGGSDRAIAKQLRAAAASLRSAPNDADAIGRIVMATAEITPDDDGGDAPSADDDGAILND